MKKAFLILGVVAVSAAAGGFTAWKVAAPREGSVQYIEREVERTPALGTQFTSYQAEQYPDLTYAAENAVKAVVNIEAIQQVEMPQRRGYDPFLEFFGIPQGYDEGPQFREQRAGGSGRDYFGGRLHRDEQPRRGRGFETQGEAQRRAFVRRQTHRQGFGDRPCAAENRGLRPADRAVRFVGRTALGRVGTGDRFAVRLAVDHHGRHRERQGAAPGRHPQRFQHRVVHPDRCCGKPG